MKDHHNGTNVFYNQMHDMMVYLLSFYKCFGTDPFDSSTAASSGKKFLMIYKSFHDGAKDKFWK